MPSARSSALSSVLFLVSLLKRKAGLVIIAVVAFALIGGTKQAWALGICAQVSQDSGNAGASQNYALQSGQVLTITISGSGSVVIYENFAGGFSQVYSTAASGTYAASSNGVFEIYSANSNFTISCSVPQTTFTVTTTADDATGVAANCATGSTNACTLRDAIAAAAASTTTGLTVNFSTATFPSTNTAAQNTITLANGTLNVPNNTTIQGLYTGSGSTLANQVTVNGGGQSTVFAVGSRSTATINNLTITGGSSSAYGGGIYDVGTLTVNQCTITANTAYSGGGGIGTGGGSTLTVQQSTISNNTGGANGGGIYTLGTTTITQSTISGNSTVSYGGGIRVGGAGVGTITLTTDTIVNNTQTSTTGAGGGFSMGANAPATLTSVTIVGNSGGMGGGSFAAQQSTVTYTNTIIEANTAYNSYADVAGAFSSGTAGANLINTGSSTTPTYTASTLQLVPLGNYGGPTQTMPTLPGGPANCTTQVTTGPTATDQRGVAIPTFYGMVPCVDSGATNSSYGVAWGAPASSYNVGANFTTTPVFYFQDDGFTIPYTGGAVGFVDGDFAIAGTVNGTFSNGSVVPTGANISQAETSDNLLGSVSALNGAITLNATSQSFSVVYPVTAFTISTLTNANAGSAQNVTITAKIGTSTATTFNGTATITSTDTAATIGGATIGSAGTSVTFTNGVATFTGTSGLVFKTAGQQSITVTLNTVTQSSNTITVAAGAASTIAATGSTTITAATGAAFGATALQVQVLDAYSNAVSGATVSYTVPTSGASATLSNATCTTSSSGICTVTATANAVPGAYSITANMTGASSATFSATNTGPAVYTVTVATDTTTGTASNCTTGGTTDANCSLRDAVAAATAFPASSTTPAVINFSPTVFNKATTLTLKNNNINLAGYITINGATSGNGSTLTNLVTVTAPGSTIFYNPSGTNEVLNNLNITGGTTGVSSATPGGSLTINQCNIYGNSSIGGGAAVSDIKGSVTITNSAIYNNTATGYGSGAGVYVGSSQATVTISNTTISGNKTTGTGNPPGNGAGIYVVNGTLNLYSTTIFGNTTAGTGGGIDIYGGTVTLTDTIVAGNTAGSAAGYADIAGTYNDNGGNAAGTSSAATSQIANVALAPLGFYGGPTETQPSLPSSTATFCTITSANGNAFNSLAATDQRGQPRTTTYVSAGGFITVTRTCADSGATQAHITTAYTTQTAPTYYQNTAFGSSAPVFTVQDDGVTLPITGNATFTDHAGNIPANSPVSANFSGGAATPTTAVITALETNDYLIGSYQYSNGTFLVTSTANSNTFNVVPPVTGFSISTLSNVTAGVGQAVMITALNGSSASTGFNGSVTITSTDAAATLGGATIGSAGTTITLTNGVAAFGAGLVFKTAGQQSITASYGTLATQASNTITVSAAAAATLSVVSGSGQSAVIGSGFTNPLLVQAVDAYSNPVGGAGVSFTAPASGASAVFASASCTTSLTATPAGSCSVTATANGTASARGGSYTVSAAMPGTPGTAFSLSNSLYTPTLTVTQSANTLVYGQPVTLTATLTPSSVAGTAPGGYLLDYDGTSAQLLNNVANAGTSWTIAVPTVGTHNYGASYSGDNNFTAVATKFAAANLVVNQAAATLSGPATQPVFVVYSQTGVVPVTIAGQYSGSGIAAPSGSIAYTIVNAAGTTVASGSPTISAKAVSIPVANTLAPGNYTVNASYAGDANYTAAAPISISLQVGQITPIVTITAPTTLTYGTALGISATATYNSAAVAGTLLYTATPTGGSAIAVTAATVLPAGTYTLTASFTPTSTLTYKSVSATSSLTVSKATPAVTLTSSVNPILVQNATVLTATVSSAASTPTGTVQFYDTTLSANIGTPVGLTGGVAAMSVSTLAVGTHAITAIYSGDPNFVTLTSSAVSEQVDDFSMTLTSSSGNSTSQTVLPGGTATYNFTISPTGATTFPAAVTLSLSGLPAGATYTLTPATIAAGAGSTPVTLTVMVPKQTALLHREEKLAPIAFALLLLPFAGRIRRRVGRLARLSALLLFLLGGMAGMAALTGCGSTTGFFASPQTTYNLTLTGTSGSLTHSTNVTLIVE